MRIFFYINRISLWMKYSRTFACLLMINCTSCSTTLISRHQALAELAWLRRVIFIKRFSTVRHASAPGSGFLPDWFVWEAQAAASSRTQTWLTHLLGRWLCRVLAENTMRVVCVSCCDLSVLQCKQAFSMLPAAGCRWWPGVAGDIQRRREGVGRLAEVHPCRSRHCFKGEFSAFIVLLSFVSLVHVSHTCVCRTWVILFSSCSLTSSPWTVSCTWSPGTTWCTVK